MKSGLVILGLVLFIAFFLVHKKRKHGFLHIQYPHDTTVNPNPSSNHQENLVETVREPVTYRETVSSSNKTNQPEETNDDQTHKVKFKEEQTNQTDSDMPVLTSKSMADLFSVKIDHAGEVGLTEGELDRYVSEYTDKYLTTKAKPIPQNIYFNSNDHDKSIRMSMKNSAISLADRHFNKDTSADPSAAKKAAIQNKEVSNINPQRQVAFASVRKLPMKGG